MNDNDWRIWLMGKLRASDALSALLPAESWFAAGSLTASPDVRPFGIIKIGAAIPGPFPGRLRCSADLWVHDDPGSYLRIGEILNVSRDVLCGAGARIGQARAADGGIVVWQGFSGDLADQDYGTILRTSSYDLNGREGNA